MEATPPSCKFCGLLAAGPLAAGPLAASLPNLAVETDHAAVVVNRRPVAPGHLTVILKRHHEQTSAMRDGDWSGVGSLLGKLSTALEAAYTPHRVVLLGDGKRSAHLHLHLIPEPKGITLALGEAVTDLNQSVRPPTLSEADTAALVQKLRTAFA